MRRVTGRRFVLGASAAGMALLSLAGCAFGYTAYGTSVTKGDVIGHWTSNCGASLDIAEGGTASVRAVPIAWNQSGDTTKIFSGTSIWGLYNAQPNEGPSGLEVYIDNVLDTLYFASVKGKLGFAYDMSYDDATGQDDEYCIFSKP